MKISVVKLKKHFGATKAVDGISFSFASDQIFGFVGPNGAGKSSTMRILATLDEPTSGDAFIDEISLIQEPEVARRLVGYVPDSLPSHRDITVHEYLDFFARAYGICGNRRRKVVADTEEFTNLGGIRDKRLHALSKGMKNRVSVARALVHDPAVLIMDEPAAGLDPRARIELRELLKVIAAQGKAVLISSHILSELAEICTGAVFIERGRILRAGTLKELLVDNQMRRTVIVRPLNRLEEVHKYLQTQPNVEGAKVTEHTIEAEVIGTEDVCCGLLSGLIHAGFAVVEFRQRKLDLEQIFMSVTKGDVQ